MRILSLVALSLALLTAGGERDAAAQANTSDPTCAGDVEPCVAMKRKEFEKRGLVGLVMKPQEKTDSGEIEAYWEVATLLPAGAAGEAGVEVGDRIVGWNDMQPLRDEPSLQAETIARTRVGDQIRLKILRDGELIEKVVIARKPDARAVEHWLAHYVYRVFGEEAQLKYIEEAEKRLHAGHDH